MNAIGPICWTAALMELKRTRDGQDVSSGKRLPSLREILADDTGWPPTRQDFRFANGHKRRLVVKSLLTCWPTVTSDQPVLVVLVRDPSGEWRDEALVCTNPKLADWEIVSGYCQRW